MDVTARTLWFSAYIMAAMREANTADLETLRALFPQEWDEIQANTPAGGGAP